MAENPRIAEPWLDLDASPQDVVSDLGIRLGGRVARTLRSAEHDAIGVGPIGRPGRGKGSLDEELVQPGAAHDDVLARIGMSESSPVNSAAPRPAQLTISGTPANSASDVTRDRLIAPPAALRRSVR